MRFRAAALRWCLPHLFCFHFAHTFFQAGAGVGTKSEIPAKPPPPGRCFPRRFLPCEIFRHCAETCAFMAALVFCNSKAPAGQGAGLRVPDFRVLQHSLRFRLARPRIEGCNQSCLNLLLDANARAYCMAHSPHGTALTVNAFARHRVARIACRRFAPWQCIPPPKFFRPPARIAYKTCRLISQAPTAGTGQRHHHGDRWTGNCRSSGCGSSPCRRPGPPLRNR